MRGLLLFVIFVAAKGYGGASEINYSTRRYSEAAFNRYVHPGALSHSISVRILNEKGVPTPARVRFTSLDNTYHAPDGHTSDFRIVPENEPVSIERDIILKPERRYAYVDGKFNIDLPVGQKIIVEVVKGYQYRIVKDTLEILSGTTSLDIPLEKWFDFPGKKWYSGDVHIHFINQETALLEMKAEDLNVANLLTSDFTFDKDRFTGRPDIVSEKEHVVFVGQEYREDRLGHINLLNIKSLVQPVSEMRKFHYPLNTAESERVHAGGGHVSWAHFAAWPGLEGPLGIVLKRVDAVELLCTIDPFQTPIFVSEVVPDLPMNSGLGLWYRLLNCGLKIPATAGTDKMNNQVTVGANRVYAEVEGKFSYEAWIEALNKGRTFITNSPLIFCKVDEAGPGGSVQLAKGKKVHVTAEVYSQLPYDRLEIIANGKVIGFKNIEGFREHETLEIDFQPGESSWIAARCYRSSVRDSREGVNFIQRIKYQETSTSLNEYFGTLRPETVFAHTSPAWVELDNQPVRSKNDIDYFVQYLNNSKEWLDKKGRFPSEDAKKEVLDTFDKGIEAFYDLLK